MIERVAILGVGLLGGSLGLALGRHRPGLHRVGYDRPEVLAEALRRGALDAAAATPTEAVRAADLVVLATPLAPMLPLLGQIAPALRPGTLVTDVGSVKQPVLAQAQAVVPPSVAFIGGHPMAGAEHRGVAHADPFLFENATYVLCPPEGASPEAVEARHPDFVALLRGIGARLLVLPAERHDRLAAAVSHLPQLLAVLLATTAAEYGNDPLFAELAAGGFRDMTRIASSPFPLWRDILAGNQGAVLDGLAHLARNLQRLRGRLAAEDYDALAATFDAAAAVRAGTPARGKGFLAPLADVFVFAEDRPGVLLSITQTLYEAQLDVKDIELLKIREGTGGTFRLGFAGPAAAEAALAALRRAGFECFRP